MKEKQGTIKALSQESKPNLGVCQSISEEGQCSEISKMNRHQVKCVCVGDMDEGLGENESGYQRSVHVGLVCSSKSLILIAKALGNH